MEQLVVTVGGEIITVDDLPTLPGRVVNGRRAGTVLPEALEELEAQSVREALVRTARRRSL